MFVYAILICMYIFVENNSIILKETKMHIVNVYIMYSIFFWLCILINTIISDKTST